MVDSLFSCLQIFLIPFLTSSDPIGSTFFFITGQICVWNIQGRLPPLSGTDIVMHRLNMTDVCIGNMNNFTYLSSQGEDSVIYVTARLALFTHYIFCTCQCQSCTPSSRVTQGILTQKMFLGQNLHLAMNFEYQNRS